MALYYYLKSETVLKTPHSFISALGLRLVSIFFFSFGFGLLSWLVWPFLEWRLIYTPRFNETEIIKPIPALGKSVAASEQLTSASSWFPQAPPQASASSVTTNYSLSIPKLKIFDAQVIVGSDDLDKSLVHYWGTALPGEKGTVIIFGHSVLPQFFNPQNYRSIFSTLHTLEAGDGIEVKADDIEYQYRIFGSEIVDPTDISFLDQRTDDYYLYLITCTPPGTYWKRLIVKAKITGLTQYREGSVSGEAQNDRNIHAGEGTEASNSASNNL